MKKVYEFNLEKYNTKDFEKNPVVTSQFSSAPEDVIGKAKIKGTNVEVEFRKDYKLAPKHELAHSYTVDDKTNKRTLVGLAIVPLADIKDNQEA